MLSNLSSFVGVITAPRKAGVFRHIEFLRLGERRVLVILVAPDGDVQNRVIITASDHTQAQLVEATNFLNAHYAGLSIDDVRERLKTEVEALSADIAALMRAAVQAGSEAIAESDEQVVVAGEHNLLGVQDLHQDMRSLREMFDVFEQKTQLMRLLEGSQPRRGRAHLHRRREPGGAVRGAVGGFRRRTRSTARWWARWASSARRACPTTA